MRIAVLSDPHLGFSRYTRVNDKGVNVREADFYSAFLDGVENLMAADVEAVLDLGDLTDTPHPKKRTVHLLVEAINATGLPWWSTGGNHTLVRHSTDIHIYELLQHFCPRFTGVQQPTYVEQLNAVLIPYGNADEIRAGLALADEHPDSLIGGHFACDDVLPDGHDIGRADLPQNRPILLGHFHGRKADDVPTYVGATERKAWGEANNPTGIAIWDSAEPGLTFIDHPARPWLDLSADPTTYQDVLAEALRGRDDAPIVRLTIAATREEYRIVDELAAHRIAANALDLTIRRSATDEEVVVSEEPVDFNLARDWRAQVKDASIPKGVERTEVERVGVDALTSVGVAA